MKITVIAITPQLQGETEDHEADWVDHDTSDGELRVTRRDRDNRVVGWVLYAAGQWHRAELTEPASLEVLQYRAAAAERDRQHPNGGRGF